MACKMVRKALAPRTAPKAHALVQSPAKTLQLEPATPVKMDFHLT